MISPRLVGVVDIGATAVRMVIAEIDKKGDWRRVDRAVKPVPLGRDVFTTGSITRETALLTLRVLAGYAELLQGWKIPLEDVRVIATSALREARNRDTLIDRIFLRTGFRVNVIEGIEENHLTYLAVQHAIRDMRGEIARTNTLIIEVGGGSTDLMLLRRGKMVGAHSLRIGTVRIEQHLDPNSDSYSHIEGYIHENIRNIRDQLESEFQLDKIKYFVAVGGDARLAAEKTGKKVGEHYSVVDKKAFLDFISHLQTCTVDEIVRLLQVTYNEAEGLVPALLMYKHFLNATSADRLYVPDVSIREGVLLSFALDTSREVEQHFYSQVIASAISLGRKLHFDEEHALLVARLALQLFDQLQAEHGLDAHARLLLEASGILHDIGNYINNLQHHKHGQYIISNSEIFGFSRGDIRIISNVVRYHRKTVPNASHITFISLHREERTTVLKLAALLRVADGLDRGHSQRISSLRVEKQDDEILLHPEYEGDLAVERAGLRLKSEMFEEVFGYTVRLI
jgi:exopolyphosphatase/guanosine-5'-triphosphate,3'-diphosphate pyrophosphatase